MDLWTESLVNQKAFGCVLSILGIASLLYGLLYYLVGYVLDPKDADKSINYAGLFFTLAGTVGLIAGLVMRSRAKHRP
jgi:hypothetical protein